LQLSLTMLTLVTVRWPCSGGTLVHVMFFHFIFDFFFGLMHVGMAHFAGHGYGMTPVRRKPDALTVKFPSAAISVVSLYS